MDDFNENKLRKRRTGTDKGRESLTPHPEGNLIQKQTAGTATYRLSRTFSPGENQRQRQTDKSGERNSPPLNRQKKTTLISSEEKITIRNNLCLLGILVLLFSIAWQVYTKHLIDKSVIPVNMDDRYSSSIFDLCLLSENLLVGIDSANKSVKIIDTELRTVVSTLYVETTPYSVTKVTGRQVAITLTDASKIQLLSINGRSETGDLFLSIDRNISVKGRPVGLEYWNGMFFVVIAYPGPGVYVLTMDGIILKNFTHFSTGDQLFKFPYLLSIYPEGNVMYITDISTNLITSLTLDGEIKAFHDAHDILLFLQISVDRRGRVYLCRTQFHEIFRLSPNLKEGEVLLNKTDGVFSPVSAAYDDKNQKLYVGSNFGNKIRVFTITK